MTPVCSLLITVGEDMTDTWVAFGDEVPRRLYPGAFAVRQIRETETLL